MSPPARVLPAIVALGLAAASRPAHAQADSARNDTTHAVTLPGITVTGRADDLIGSASSASEGSVGAADLRSRPIAREGELLETVPGMIVTQHSGEGKANQYFVRGFNLDHGTDFQTTVEGMPVNMPSHAHGQGYTDLNFLIPELVDHLDYRLGVYHSEIGDFGSAGAAEFHLARRLNRPFLVAAAGEHDLLRLAAGVSPRVGGGNLLIAGEAKGYNGPWERPEEIRKLSGVFRYTWSSANSAFSILGMGYHNRWNSSDQIPLRAVEDGTISPLGQIDSTDGGHTQRYSLSGSWHHSGANSSQDATIYGIYSDLSLFSDFTFFLDDPVNGDQFNQREKRAIVGLGVSHAQVLAATQLLTVGLQSRADFIDGLGLYHTVRQERIGTVRQDDVREWGTGVFLKLDSHWRSWFRTELGLRADGYAFHVASSLPANSGDRTAGIVSPKASLVFTPSNRAELYLSGGFGFHSNDARGTTITVDPSTGQPASQVDPLVRSRGAEAGSRLSPVHGMRSTVALWVLDLDSELLFTGDGGTTEPSAASRRYGVTLANFYRPIPRLSLDLDISVAHARFRGVAMGADHIPGALENVVAAGVSWFPPRVGVFGALRLRHFGSYPLIEDNSVRASPTNLVSADAGYLFGNRMRVTLTVLNLLDAEDDDIQYYYTSRLNGEAPVGVDDVHFHPVEPRQVRVSLEYGL
ncbi:MAG TPA: TonB-dependent receptor [Gemmatimonadales bacterium]|nr:TonB-dependent receptor [Gemmatimonadales bacterium]